MLLPSASKRTCHTWNDVPLPSLAHNNICCIWHLIHWHSDQLFMFFLWLTCSLTYFLLFICVTEEKRKAQSVRLRLWELLAPAGLTEDMGASPWLQAYRRLLQEEGADEETQKKAVLMQLWATQVSLLSEEKHWVIYVQSKHLSWLSPLCLSHISSRRLEFKETEIEIYMCSSSTLIRHMSVLFTSAFTAVILLLSGKAMKRL